MNDCDEPQCPCEGYPTLARLYALRAALGLAVQAGLYDVAKYDGLRVVVRAHEAAWQAAYLLYFRAMIEARDTCERGSP